jgi:co-chaperonin GroES (HSP10)
MRYLTPLDNRVLLQRIEPPTETQSGLYIPNSVVLKEFTVIAVGEAANPRLTPGQTVWTDRTDKLVELDGLTFMLITDKEIGGIIYEDVFSGMLPED